MRPTRRRSLTPAAARIMTLAAAGFILVGLGFSFGLPSDKRREPVDA